MLLLQNRNDLQRLIDEGLEESLSLDYKDSRALSREGAGPGELCKDVTALANSAGGQLIYGIEEDKGTHKPKRVDGGVSDPKITREWIEQVLNSRVQPRMTGVQTTRIDMENGNFGYVINVPQSRTGPHQAPDQKYYKRFDLQSVPMHDYEIRDIMRRATTPDLDIEFFFDKMQKRQMLRYGSEAEHHIPIGLTPVISNRSNEPALYAVVLVYVDCRLSLADRTYEYVGRTDHDGVPVTAYRVTFLPSKNMPIFKEQPTLLPSLGIIIPEDKLYLENDYMLAFEIRSPGCHASQSCKLMVEYGKVLVIEDGLKPPKV